MHIAFVIDSLGGGGAEQVVYRLVDGLSERGHKVDVVVLQTVIYHHLPQCVRVFLLGGGPDRLTEERSAHVLARSIQLRPPSRTLEWAHRAFEWAQAANALNWNPRFPPSLRLVRQARAVASYLGVEGPDCVLPNIARAIWATLLGLRMVGENVPVIPMVHGDVHHLSYRSRRKFQHLFPGAAHFVGVSRGVSESLVKAVGVSKESITTIYNPVVTPDLHAKAAEQPNHPWFRDRSTQIILAAGRLTKVKDYPTLIHAFARLARLRPCRLIILGEGSLRQELERLVGKMHLTDRVSFPGWVENPFAFMAQASLFVLSSISEGLPNVLSEAMACGCPCVSTDCPFGPAEILRNGGLGPLVPVGDDAALAEAMAYVLDHPPDGCVLRQRGMDFSAERSVDAYEQLIESLVASRTAKTPDDARLT